jgi:hypothetical protein
VEIQLHRGRRDGPIRPLLRTCGREWLAAIMGSGRQPGVGYFAHEAAWTPSTRGASPSEFDEQREVDGGYHVRAKGVDGCTASRPATDSCHHLAFGAFGDTRSKVRQVSRVLAIVAVP